MTPPSATIAKGTSEQFTAIAALNDQTTEDLKAGVTWTSSSPDVATVTSTGLATGLIPGTTNLTATSGGLPSNTVTLTVTAALLTSITVTPPEPEIASGIWQPFTATGTYSDQTTQDLTGWVTWTATPLVSGTATLTSGGVAIGTGVGTVTITATYGVVSGTAILTVTPVALTAVTLTPPAPSIAIGTAQQFVAIGTFSDQTTQDLTPEASWTATPLAGGTATIASAGDTPGRAIGTGAGTVTITATYEGVSGTAILTVSAATLTSLAVIPSASSVPLEATEQFTAIGTYSDSSTQDLTDTASWTAATLSGGTATITSTGTSRGLATAKGVGTVAITATLGGVAGTAILTVTPATLTSVAVTPPAPSIGLHTTLQFTALGTYSDLSTADLTETASWTATTLAAGTATITSANADRGLATGTGVGTVTITATADGLSGSTVLTVTSATLASLSVTPAAPSILNGTTQQFTATGTFSDQSTQDLTHAVSWTTAPLAGGTATITNKGPTRGLATGTGVGTVTITATSGAVSGTAVLTVSAP